MGQVIYRYKWCCYGKSRLSLMRAGGSMAAVDFEQSNAETHDGFAWALIQTQESARRRAPGPELPRTFGGWG
jgi:hypothetical protein